MNVGPLSATQTTTQQTGDIEPLLVKCWSTVNDAGQTLNQQSCVCWAAHTHLEEGLDGPLLE